MPVQIDEVTTEVRTVPPAGSESAQGGVITPELVRMVADLIYRQLMEEMRVERERGMRLKGKLYGRR